MIVPTMPGWMVQWYVNEPALVKVRLNVPPGAMVPEFQAPPSAVAVCGTESALVQATVAPTATVSGLGAKALVVRDDAPAPMLTPAPMVASPR